MVAKCVPQSDADVDLVHRHVGFLQDVPVYPVLVDGPDGGDVSLDELGQGDGLEVGPGTRQPQGGQIFSQNNFPLKRLSNKPLLRRSKVLSSKIPPALNRSSK